MQEDAFLALLNHEMRGPVGALAAAAQVLQECDPTGADAAEARDVVARQARRLSAVLHELQELARLRSTALPAGTPEVDLVEGLRRWCRDAAAELSPSRVMVRVDAARLEEAVVRTLRECRPGGCVRLVVEPAGAILTVGPLGNGLGEHFTHALLMQGGATVGRERHGPGTWLVARLPVGAG